MTHLATLGTISRAIVARELHADATFHHFHASVSYTKKLNIRPGRENPFFLRNQAVKARVLLTKNVPATWNYCRKEDKTPLIQGTPASPPKRKREESYATCLEMARTGPVATALTTLMESQPRDCVLYYNTILGTLTTVHNAANAPKIARRQLTEFKRHPIQRPMEPKAYILSGATGLGKTQFAAAVLADAPIIRHLDMLRGALTTGGLIFDDICVGHLPFTCLVSLLDWDVEGQVHIRYTVASIPPCTPKIFTTNAASMQSWVYDGRDERKCPVSPEQFSALERRCVWVKPTEPLFEPQQLAE